MILGQFKRLDLRWSQQELAKRAHLPQADISLIEQKRLIPRQDQLERLASALGITPPSALLKDITVRDLAVDDEESVEQHA